MAVVKSYDPACYDLAAAFLSDHPDKNTEANRDQLAELIQRTIEQEIEYGMTPPPPPSNTPKEGNGR
jgi:hypothetical protein